MAWSYQDIDNFYNRVRAELDNVSNGSLTDEQMDMPEKAPYAEAKIKNSVPSWETYQTEDLDRFAIFESCIVIQTAMYFESYVDNRRPNSMKSSSIEIQFSESSTLLYKQSLLEKLEERLALIEEDGTTTFFGFRVT